jgi:hypothetical protein
MKLLQKMLMIVVVAGSMDVVETTRSQQIVKHVENPPSRIPPLKTFLEEARSTEGRMNTYIKNCSAAELISSYFDKICIFRKEIEDNIKRHEDKESQISKIEARLEQQHKLIESATLIVGKLVCNRIGKNDNMKRIAFNEADVSMHALMEIRKIVAKCKKAGILLAQGDYISTVLKDFASTWVNAVIYCEFIKFDEANTSQFNEYIKNLLYKIAENNVGMLLFKEIYDSCIIGNRSVILKQVSTDDITCCSNVREYTIVDFPYLTAVAWCDHEPEQCFEINYNGSEEPTIRKRKINKVSSDPDIVLFHELNHARLSLQRYVNPENSSELRRIKSRANYLTGSNFDEKVSDFTNGNGGSLNTPVQYEDLKDKKWKLRKDIFFQSIEEEYQNIGVTQYNGQLIFDESGICENAYRIAGRKIFIRYPYQRYAPDPTPDVKKVNEELERDQELKRECELFAREEELDLFWAFYFKKTGNKKMTLNRFNEVYYAGSTNWRFVYPEDYVNITEFSRLQSQLAAAVAAEDSETAANIRNLRNKLAKRMRERTLKMDKLETLLGVS